MTKEQPRCVTEISVVESPQGHFVTVTINGNIEATKGPFDQDRAYLVAKELAKRAADTPHLISFGEVTTGGKDEAE